MRKPLLALAAALVAAAALSAQQAPPTAPPPTQTPATGQPQGSQPSPPQGQRPPVFRGGTESVRVDVTVTDRKGNPVTDLSRDDFEVREDGVQQTVDTIKMIHATGEAPDDDVSLAIRSPEHAAVEAARDDIRVFVIFWDEYHIGQFVPAIRGREVLGDFVQSAFGPTDLVALMDQLTPTDAIRLTRDRRALAEQTRKLQGRLNVYMPVRSGVEEAQMYQMRDIERLRSQVTTSALESTIAYLGQLKEGRKAIIFVSQTIGRVGDGPGDNYTWLDGAIRLANANNTTIYTLDPRGLDMTNRVSDILLALAENTGGRQFSGNAPAAALRTVVKEASAFYLVGYRSEKNPTDGKFHKIAVHVKRPGVEVKARTGYYAPSAVDMEAAKRKAAENTAPPEIEKALSTLVDAPHLPSAGDFWAGASVGDDGTPRITAIWTPREGSAASGVLLHATAADGRVLFDGPMTAGPVSFAAAPGTIHLRQTLNDTPSSTAGRQDTTIDVPDFSALPLSIATPILYRARTPLELRAIQAAVPTPFAGRQFERTDRIIVRFDVLGAAASDATVTVALLSRLGAKLATMPLRKTATGPYEVDLPIASVGRGDYVFEFAASHGADQVKALLSFRVN
ncbi:MAG TPA: VWA domain-containing protein [Vicinamibacterales bacterium]|jgi:VWFA-related protein